MGNTKNYQDNTRHARTVPKVLQLLLYLRQQLFQEAIAWAVLLGGIRVRKDRILAQSVSKDSMRLMCLHPMIARSALKVGIKMRKVKPVARFAK